MVDFISIGLFLYIGYVLGTIVFLLLDNRESASTFAWILLIVVLPVIGLLVYLLIGRNWRRLSKKKQLSKQLLRRELVGILRPLINRESKEISIMKKKGGYSYKQELLQLLHGTSNSVLTSRNKVKILHNGKEKFDSLLEDLKNAKKFIHMEYFIWRDDELTRRIRDILIGKAAEGVEVRLLYDAFGGLLLSRSYRNSLWRAGVKIFPYFNFLKPFKFHTINYRNHRKIAIIDGEIGYVGGMNLAKEYIDGGKRFKSWRDTHLRIEGEAVAILQGVFSTSWFNTTHERLFSEKYFPMTRAGTRRIPIQVTTSGPDSAWESIKQLYFALITSAEKRVWIQSPYLIPDQSVLMALKTAAMSGIDVRIMMTGIPDKKLPYWSAFTYMKDLLRAGVKVYHYKKGFMHAKTIAVDGEVCSIGTANMDIRSFHLNYELNTLIYDRNTASKLEKDFEKDMGHCNVFSLTDYYHQGFTRRLRNSIARLLAPLL